MHDARLPMGAQPSAPTRPRGSSDEWARPLFAHYRALSVMGIVLGVIAVLFAGALMFTSGYMISLAASVPLTVLALHIPSIFVRIFGIGKPLIDYVQRLSTHDWVLRATSHLRRKLYRTLESMQSSVVESKRSGEVLGLLAEDIEHIQNLCIRTVFPFAIAVIVYIIICIALGLFNIFCGLLAALLFGVVLFVVPLLSLGVVRPAVASAQASRDRMHVDALEDLRGVEVWSLGGRRSGFLEGFRQAQAAHGRARSALERAAGIRSVAVQALVSLGIAGTFVFAALAFGESSPALQGAAVEGLSQVGGEDGPALAANWIAAFALCAFPLFETLAHGPDESLGVVEHEAAIARLNELSREAEGKPAPGLQGHRTAAWSEGACVGHPGDRPAIRFHDISFAYPDSRSAVIDGLSAEIPFGSHVALVGPSGSGKSTLARLIYGELAPTAGTVTIGGVTSTALMEPHRTMATLYQNAYLFDASLRENLLVANGHASDEELVRVLRQVGLGDVVDGADRGLDLAIGEGGTRLSGGQRQRVALARMLLTDAPIVILDEPFLWVDEETEQVLGALIAEVMADRTVLLITHHDRDVDGFDKVIRL